eukprot:TRINITY_DN6853_c0_g1_i1.p1 TRINITY_DN6853_c0_g1~~TRINITY_DN6853_c0_g1_i1.p1  ORF type:complete len:564 (+),score=114.54 TRINITY_DN6853_c0_g1_i1:150-1841(+)
MNELDLVNFEDLIPKDFICPIAGDDLPMTDPVVAADGYSYERKFIQQWFDHGGKLSPMTGNMLTDFRLTPNTILRNLIRQFIEDHPTINIFFNIRRISVDVDAISLRISEIKDNSMKLLYKNDIMSLSEAISKIQSSVMEANLDLDDKLTELELPEYRIESLDAPRNEEIQRIYRQQTILEEIDKTLNSTKKLLVPLRRRACVMCGGAGYTILVNRTFRNAEESTVHCEICEGLGDRISVMFSNEPNHHNYNELVQSVKGRDIALLRKNIEDSRIIRLPRSNIENDDVMAILLSLIGNESITGIDLCGNNIGDQGVSLLSTMIDSIPTVAKYGFSSNNISRDGAIAIGNILTTPYVKTLYMDGNFFGHPISQEAIGNGLNINTTLKTLDISNCAMRDSGIIRIVTALMEHPTLKVLYLASNYIEDSGAETIAEFLKTSKIRALLLNNNNIGNTGVNAIGQVLTTNTNLNFLTLSKNEISDAGIRQLVNHLSQREVPLYLDLSWNEVGESGQNAIEHLLQNNSNIKIRMKLTPVTEDDEPVSSPRQGRNSTRRRSYSTTGCSPQ